MYLMLKDVPILKFDITNGEYNVIRPELLPMKIRDRMIDNMEIKDDKTKYQLATKNHTVLINFFSTRVLNLDRENAKKILNAYHFSQSQDSETKTKIAIACRCVSMTDDYWISDDAKTFTWKDINPRENKLNKIISHVALLGTDLTATGLPHTPELTGRGAYAKAWIREGDGHTYLYKAGTRHADVNESKIEVSVSKILDKTNVPHVRYSDAKFEDKYVCKCRNMCSDKLSIVPAEDVEGWCNRTEKTFDTLVKEVDSENYYKTLVIDYLISNTDRHGQNWGFYQDNVTGELKGLHPLYDHNNAFTKQFLDKDKSAPSLMVSGKTQKEAAKHAIKNCKFKITGEITPELFPNYECYHSFMEKACELEIYQKKEYNLIQQLFKGKSYEYELNPAFKGQEIDWEKEAKQERKDLQKQYKMDMKNFQIEIPVRENVAVLYEALEEEESFDEYLDRINQETKAKMEKIESLEKDIDNLER